MSDNEIEDFVVPILDEAMSKVCTEGQRHACCASHLMETITSCHIKNIVRGHFALIHSIEGRIPTMEEMKDFTTEIILMIRAYYDVCKDETDILEVSKQKTGGNLH